MDIDHIKHIKCEVYKGNLALVNELRASIQDKYAYLFTCVLVHGSVATGEVIPYSDFDGLLIVKDAYKDSKELKRFKHESLKKIYKFDPLQHHGWFEIMESQLGNYPQTYFPHELYEYSKLIFPNNLLELSIILPDKIDFHEPFVRLADSIEKKIKSGFKSNNIFKLKSMLSEIMLLPTIFLQAKYKKGVFKKHSFELARTLFSEKAWSVINISSEIRNEWVHNLSLIQMKLLQTRWKKIRKLTNRYLLPDIPEYFSKKLDQNFYQSLQLLIYEMNQHLDNNKNN